MKPTLRRLVRPAIALPLVLGLVACDSEEKDKLRADLDKSKQEETRLTKVVADLAAKGDAAQKKLADLDKDVAHLRDEVRAAGEASDGLKGQLASATAARDAAVADLEKAHGEEDTRKEDLERVTSHRDELKEWIEQELLPIAEEKDPRLANLRDAAKDMAAEVERIRGLKFKQPFMRRLISREKVGEWMRRDIKKDLPEEEAKKMVTVGAAMGLFAPGTDIYEVFSQFIESGAAAFYKPETGTFYHIEGNDGRGARPVVFHELVHAVEDQYFSLDAFYRAVEKDADMALARRGLVEGSACHFASKYEAANPEDVKAMMQSQMTPELVKKQIQMVASVPPVLIATIGLYPYKNAPEWLAKIGADDAAAIEGLYKDPPVSTEQVMHPEKFPLTGARDYPHLVAAPDVKAILGEGWEHVEDNDVGELTIGILLTQLAQNGKYAPTFMGVIDMNTQGIGIRGAAKTASEGWDGDRYTAWIEKATSRVTLVWTSVWDSEKDATEFLETYGSLLGKRVLGKSFTDRPTPVRYTDPSTGRISGVDVQGNRVVAVIDAPADKADALFAAGRAAVVTADPRDPNDK